LQGYREVLDDFHGLDARIMSSLLFSGSGKRAAQAETRARRRHHGHARVFSDSLLLPLEQTDERVVRDEPPTAELHAGDSSFDNAEISDGKSEAQNPRRFLHGVTLDRCIFWRRPWVVGLASVVNRLSVNLSLKRRNARVKITFGP
jgi:hypothetical protein